MEKPLESFGHYLPSAAATYGPNDPNSAQKRLSYGIGEPKTASQGQRRGTPTDARQEDPRARTRQ